MPKWKFPKVGAPVLKFVDDRSCYFGSKSSAPDVYAVSPKGGVFTYLSVLEAPKCDGVQSEKP